MGRTANRGGAVVLRIDLGYDQAGHEFVFTWKLRGGVGPATIAATVAYPGSPATTTTKSLPITITT